MVSLGLKALAAGLKAQTNPLSFGGTHESLCPSFFASNSFRLTEISVLSVFSFPLFLLTYFLLKVTDL